MPTQTYKRPGLRPAAESLIASCVPILRDGGRLPLARVVESAMGTVRPALLQPLQGRGEILFERLARGCSFSNNGPHIKIALRRFDLVVPPRICGDAIEVPGGIAFRFDPAETFRASKFLLSVNLERLEVTAERILVQVQGGLFDQRIDLV